MLLRLTCILHEDPARTSTTIDYMLLCKNAPACTQGHALFTRQAGSLQPCPPIDIEGVISCLGRCCLTPCTSGHAS